MKVNNERASLRGFLYFFFSTCTQTVAKDCLMEFLFKLFNHLLFFTNY